MSDTAKNSVPTDILIVDDTPVNLRLLSDMFQEQGYHVRKAISGKMALIAIETKIPDLILLDVNMPEMNGYQVCERLQEQEKTRHTPVIFISALNEPLDKVKAFQVGGRDYVTKPFAIEEVLARVRHQLELKRLNEQLCDRNQQLQKVLDQLDNWIYYMSHYSEVTGLPNRELFCDRLNTVLGQLEFDRKRIAILVLSIDDFTTISHGFETEEVKILLRAIAQRLTRVISAPNQLAHLNGGEFAIAIVDLPSVEAVIEQIQVLLRCLTKTFYLEGRQLNITASIGITSIDSDRSVLEDSPEAAQLLQQADLALHQAKEQGRQHYQFYSPQINEQLQERLMLEHELHGALEQGQLQLYYQPLIDLQAQKVNAVEALLRWHHPTLGLISPGKFIPIAESNGSIIAIGEWVLQTACLQNVAWQKAGLPPMRVSVNLSARQFDQPNLVDFIRQTLEETGLAPSQLELEVTESFLMADIDRSIQILHQLRDLGTIIALDDFGTGYSSLSYLQRLPVDMLKVDRSFVINLLSNRESTTVTDAIIALANSLQLQVTAEGIETQEQFAYLHERGCHEGQGFYFSPPVRADTITNVLMEPEFLTAKSLE